MMKRTLVAAVLALAAGGWQANLARTFFAEMGGAYGSIIVLTVTAQCFGAGLSALGVSGFLLALAEGAPWALAPTHRFRISAPTG